MKKFLFNATITNFDYWSFGKLFKVGSEEFTFESAPEDHVSLTLKRDSGKWVLIDGALLFGIYTEQLGKQIEEFFSAKVHKRASLPNQKFG